MNKNFTNAPKPKPNIDAKILKRFENNGIGTDQKTDTPVPMKRLSFDIPVKTHKLFKTLCTAHDKIMASEILHLIEGHIVKLSKLEIKDD